MTNLKLSALLVAFVAALSACAPTGMQNSGATEANLDQDLDGDGIIDGDTTAIN
ncbi:hypothetical protein RM543_03550 [Roseicyclus sp. F158]|uniref:EF-hand domain-containing protein n=1 Tax=Tropicimonas omnivorans TaxID=3075590 RepID=A0ABU3DDY3_9RHOB|nr:hypothetical protein [Roseicyclus sp. F158]MDT0681749.1 hypothetical protein [Roseicyclus sp. F158]